MFVPVLSVAGRRPSGPVIANLPQNGLTFLLVLPARMSVTMNAACGLMTCLPAGGTYGGWTSLPFASLMARIVVWGIPCPPLAERAVGGHEIDRADLLDAEGQGQLGGAVALELHPEFLGLGEDVVRLVDGHRLDRRDVERELERVADADGAALEAVGVVRRVAAAEVRRRRPSASCRR